MSRRAFLGLGSNLGERLMYLRGAIDAIPDLVSVSSLYETDPIGGPEQGAYLNCVVALDTDLTPRELLELCRSTRGQPPTASELSVGDPGRSMSMLCTSRARWSISLIWSFRTLAGATGRSSWSHLESWRRTCLRAG